MSPTVSAGDVPSPQPGVRAVSALPARQRLPTASKRVTCTYHCGSCGRHFVSLEAFDLHLGGSLAWRTCVDPNDVEGDSARTRLVPKDTDGICAIGATEVHGVTVWQTEGAQNAGSRFV